MKPWWNKKYGNEHICAITRIRLRSGVNKDGLSRVIFLNCKHGFYRKALQEWIKNSPIPICPLCRKSFKPETFYLI